VSTVAEYASLTYKQVAAVKPQATEEERARELREHLCDYYTEGIVTAPSLVSVDDWDLNRSAPGNGDEEGDWFPRSPILFPNRDLFASALLALRLHYLKYGGLRGGRLVVSNIVYRGIPAKLILYFERGAKGTVRNLFEADLTQWRDDGHLAEPAWNRNKPVCGLHIVVPQGQWDGDSPSKITEVRGHIAESVGKIWEDQDLLSSTDLWRKGLPPGSRILERGNLGEAWQRLGDVADAYLPKILLSNLGNLAEAVQERLGVAQK
jgi:hypothetical protein